MNHRWLIVLNCLLLAQGSFAQPANTPGKANEQTQEQFPFLGFNHLDLKQVAQWTRKLVAQQQPPDSDHLKSIARYMTHGNINFSELDQIKAFPRASHIRDYFLTRPWTLYTLHHHNRLEFASLFQRTSNLFVSWSNSRDPYLEQLSEPQPAIRALAIEALSVMHDPEDVPKIAVFLDDLSRALPILTSNMCIDATTFFDQNQTFDRHAPTSDPVMLRYSWQDQTVKQYAQLALERMTGIRFENKAQFDTWWTINQDAKNCYWYWQQRLTREMAIADLATSFHIKRPDETWQRYQSRLEKISQVTINEVRQTAIDELAKLPTEVQTKIVMFCELELNTGILWLVPQSHRMIFPQPPTALHINPEHLLDYLENPTVWPDLQVPSHLRIVSQTNPHHHFIGNLLRWGYRLFEPTHLPRLQTLLQSTQYQHENSGRLGILFCIAMLHPKADTENLDDPDTRDGILRHAIRTEPSRDMQRWCVELLTRVGLPQNASMLKEIAFNVHADDPDNEMMQSILKVLIARPLTETKRDFLVDLLLDKRFDRWWVHDRNTMGSDMCCRYAIDAVNVYAGYELIDNALENRIRFPEQNATEAIPDMRKRIAKLQTLSLPQ